MEIQIICAPLSFNTLIKVWAIFQDLPNYAQHMVPIFSLPQEWLWCESWCGNATKLRAKTIDLCNNPMTKEPKLQVTIKSMSILRLFFHFLSLQELCIFLQGAKRIVAEWPDLDLEARRFTAKILGENIEPQEQSTSTPPTQTQNTNEASSLEDQESRAEL